MEELIKLLAAFRSSLFSLHRIYQELAEVMDREEELIVQYRLSELDRIVTEKDQIVQRATNVESRRIKIAEKICFLIAYNSRGKRITLSEFHLVFERYLENIRSLVEESIFTRIAKEYEEFKTTSTAFSEFFKQMDPRIYRNKQVIKGVLKNITNSVNFFEQALSPSMQYDALGKAKIHRDPLTATTSLRVRV